MTRPQAVNLARQLWADGDGGWTVAEIRDYLARHGHKVVLETVRRWVDPKWAAEFYRSRNETRRRWDRERRGTTEFRVLDDDARRRLGLDVPVEPPSKLTDELLLALRVEDRLTYTAIAAVARRFFGEELDEDGWRRRLYGLGAPKNPNKSRPRRAA